MTLTKENKEVIDSLRSNFSPDEIFIEQLLAYLKVKYPHDASRSNKISVFKFYVKQNNLVAENKLYLIRDDELRRRLNIEREEKQENIKQKLNLQIIDKIIEFKDSDNPEKLLIYLLFVTGRRISEFLNGKFNVRGERLYINEISKKRETPHPAEGYEIHLAEITPDQFISRLEKYRQKNKRTSTEAIRKAANRILMNPSFAPINTVKDLRPLYVHYLKSYDDDIKVMQGNQAIKNILHHDSKTTSIFYNDKFDIVRSFSDWELKKMKRDDLKQLLMNNGINKKNTKKFNSLKKAELIELVKKNKITTEASV